MEKIIEIRDLKVNAGKKEIINGLDIDIYANRVNTIVGPS